MKYRHISTGTIVESAGELPVAIYEKVDPEPAPPEAKPAKKNKQRKAKEQ